MAYSDTALKLKTGGTCCISSAKTFTIFIIGKEENEKWLLALSVFVVLHDKTSRETEVATNMFQYEAALGIKSKF